jgi:hypothetical protein
VVPGRLQNLGRRTQQDQPPQCHAAGESTQLSAVVLDKVLAGNKFASRRVAVP